jgi:hypothetical protein
LFPAARPRHAARLRAGAVRASASAALTPRRLRIDERKRLAPDQSLALTGPSTEAVASR